MSHISGKAIDPFPLAMFALVVVGILFAFGASVILPTNGVAATAGMGDSGKTISMSEGSTIKVILDENPTTGYSWNLTTTPGLRVVDSQYASSGSGLAGAGGVHEWTLEATDKGLQHFSGVYKRPWEPVAGDEKTFTLDVSVS